MKMKKNKMIICDLDGTLFDTSEVNYQAYKKSLYEIGYELSYSFFIKECYGKHYKEFLSKLNLTEEEKEVYNYKNINTMFEGLPDYGEEVLVTDGKAMWIDSFDKDENGLVYLSGTDDDVNDVFAWRKIKMPDFNSLAESGAERSEAKNCSRCHRASEDTLTAQCPMASSWRL